MQDEDHLAGEHDAALRRRSVRRFKIGRLKTLQSSKHPKADIECYLFDRVVRQVNYFHILSIKIAYMSIF